METISKAKVIVTIDEMMDEERLNMVYWNNLAFAEEDPDKKNTYEFKLGQAKAKMDVLKALIKKFENE